MTERDDIHDPLLAARVKAALEQDVAPAHLVHRLEDLARTGPRPALRPRPASGFLALLPQFAGLALLISLIWGSARALGFGQAARRFFAALQPSPASPGVSPELLNGLFAIGAILLVWELMRRMPDLRR